MAELDAVQIAAKAMVDRLREALGPATIYQLSERQANSIAKATIEAYLRARIIDNSHDEVNGEP